MKPGLGKSCDESMTAPPFGGRALVVFGGDTALPWLRMLKPGFRHCFVLVERAGGWVVVNPLSHQTELAWLERREAGDLANAYRRHGFRVVPYAVIAAPPTAAPWRPYTCVEAVKRVLGIHHRWVWTPWALYRHIRGARTQKNTY
ncbi:hypothetical protein EDD55_107105 [Varunaivibrio sulfuroxidans]|uniref:Uncharacterized protein n=2 Tax=Varunaivibrio sulfuroxidans TaxID=1773489 RepID=A0A4R3J9L5_9PROT|nr:hypothetical protein EDD55_107105 [Varunaivibrio sulfuroxidans]